MITFGLTGNICCGKSTVSRTFRANHIPMVDADIIARQVVQPGTIGLQMMSEAFPEFLLEDGTLDRPKLGNMLFNNTEKLALCNSILHPLITEEADKQLKAYHDQGFEIVGWDAALICENGNANKFYPLVMVKCTEQQQLARLMKRGTGHGPLTEEHAQAIIKSQMPMSDKTTMCDFIINTSYDVEHSIKQTENVILCLKVELRDQIMQAREALLTR